VEVLLGGTIISVIAGVFEEIGFRWLIFFSSIMLFPLVDWLLLGFAGVHLVQLLYEYIMCPIANFLTLGYLQEYLLGEHGWVVGAAIVSVNASFRKGHAYLGFVGWMVSWFVGMYLFW